MEGTEISHAVSRTGVLVQIPVHPTGGDHSDQSENLEHLTSRLHSLPNSKS